MPVELAQTILNHLRERETAMAELVTRLAESESPSLDPDAQKESIRIVHEALEERGYSARHYPGRQFGGVLLAAPAERDRGRPLQLLLGHLDTVWPAGTLKSMPVEVVGSDLRGPGVYDMKGGVVQGIFAIEALRALTWPLAVTPIVFLNTDEEIGSRESTPDIRRLSRAANRVFVLEPSLGATGKLKTARKGIGRFTVRVKGRAAHAGLDPEKGASAILELSIVIQKLFALNDVARGVTVNVGTIDGGLRPNVVAPESKAIVDVRVLTHDDADWIEKTIHALEASTPGTSLAIEGRIGRPPMERTRGNRLLWRMACDAAEDLGLDQLEEETAGGGSDGNTASQYAPTLDGLGPVGDGAHASHEHLRLNHMAERAALLALLMHQPPILDGDVAS